MTPDTLIHWLRNPEMLDKEAMLELSQVLRAYPCFSAVRMLYLKALYQIGDLNYHSELFKTSLSVPDRRVLYYFINDLPFPLTASTAAADTGAAPADSQAFGLIDDFLQSRPEEISSQLPSAGIYAGYSLEREHGDGRDVAVANTDLVEFLAHPQEHIDAAEKGQALPEDFDSLSWEVLPEYAFTETLARIYLKQKKYERALEIFKSLMLKNPEKSIYFADRIRFLEKVINHLNK